MFHSVKDIDNKCTHNVWSGTDYLDNTTGTDGPATAASSSDFSSNGDRSFKITFDGGNFKYLNFISQSVGIGDVYSASIKILNNSGNSVTLRLIETSNSHLSDVTVDSSESVQTINLSNFTCNTSGLLKLQINSSNESMVYIDEICLKKV